MSTSKNKSSFLKWAKTKGKQPEGQSAPLDTTNPGSPGQTSAIGSTTDVTNNLRLLCLIEGESVVFTIEVPYDSEAASLHKAIKQERKLDESMDVHTLELWKVNIDLKTQTPGSLSQFQINENDPGVDILTWKPVSEYWSDQPPRGHVHLIAKVPTTQSRPFKRTRMSLSYPRASENSSRRTNTVAALYERLNYYAFIHVRGTPASGKTTLAQLLAEHISQHEIGVRIIWVYGWPMADVKKSGNYYSYLKQQGWEEDQNTVFIFDDAQLTYEDGQLWGEFFKSIHGYVNKRRAIIFTGYGSPTSRINIKGTLLVIVDSQRITLHHVAHEDRIPPAGLLFTRSEFDDLVMKDYPSPQFYFHPSFFDALFNITDGHVGAIHDFMKIILADDSYRNLESAPSPCYSWDFFLAEVSPQDLLRKLEDSASIFARGLPPTDRLQSPPIASIFSAVLCNSVVTDADFSTDDERSALQTCFHNGWLHTDNLNVIDLPQNIGYFFPSPLHRWYIEWKLLDSFPPTPFKATSLLQFVIDIIHRFSPHILSAERRIGPGCIQRIHEAQYQDELYRCCHVLSKGSLITFPEFGTTKGRVDFYIPANKWGIELLRDGNELARHSGRFSNTGSYTTTLPLSDYVIIDCRTTHPKTEHPYLSNLYHAIFEDNFQNVCILDNKLHPVSGGKFRLLASS